MKQRRFKLTIALKIVDQEENNDVTADDETNEVTKKEKEKADEKKVFDITFQQTLIKTFRM